MIAGVVTEGSRDFPIFEAVIKQLCPTVQDVKLIHPPGDELSARRWGDGGTTGWTGVRRWCRRWGPRLTRFMNYGEPLDLLVIAVDATIAHNEAINLERPCPPASDTTDALRDLVVQWMGCQPPPNVIIVVPSKTPDAWVCAALMGGDNLLECEPEPLEKLVSVQDLYPPFGFRLKRRPDGRAKKPTSKQYRIHLAPRVAAHFDQVRGICGEAERFAREVQVQCCGEG
jgi:hypothetical protein